MKKSTKRPRLKVVAASPVVETTGTHEHPEGVPAGASLCAYHAVEDYPHAGVYEGDYVIAWEGAPLGNYDLIYIDARGEDFFGRYHSAPGGYVRLEEGDEVYHVFKPSEIVGIWRVMHVERRGEDIRRFPLGKGGA